MKADVDIQDLQSFAARYTAAWCSQVPSQVASFFASEGILTINGGEPASGRAAITRVAAEFMTAFPDMKVMMDALESAGGRTLHRWTLVGTNSGPEGTGNRIRISGYEDWLIGNDGLIAESLGYFDADEYARQIAHGADG